MHASRTSSARSELRTAEYKIGISHLVWNTSSKDELIPHKIRALHLVHSTECLVLRNTNFLCTLYYFLCTTCRACMKALNRAPIDEPIPHQLVGKVMAYQGYDG